MYPRNEEMKFLLQASRITLFSFLFLFCVPVAAQEWGRFSGEPHVEFLGNGRDMRVLAPFSFTDPAGVIWDVPPGAVTDGASIPRVFWTIAAPFEGKYRDAAVVHDYFCVTKSRTWSATHLMFYHGMRASGVDELTAKTMYGAVYYFGPRWGIGSATKGPGAEKDLSTDEEKLVVKNLRDWIAHNHAGVADIDRRLDTAPVDTLLRSPAKP
jgi:uncharacterized protein DUF1353